MEKAGLSLARTFHYTPEDMSADSATHVATGDLWDGADVEYALERADWARMEAASADAL
jgi:hypothetical protein